MKPVPSLNGIWADQDGNIWSTKTGKPRKLSVHRSFGYRRVTLRNPGSYASAARVCRLVCEAFNGPAPSAECLVRHLDGNRSNDRPRNLQWGSALENFQDGIDHGTIRQSSAGKFLPAPKWEPYTGIDQPF